MKRTIPFLKRIVCLVIMAVFLVNVSGAYGETAMVDYKFDVVPAKSIEDFYGTWRCAYVSSKGFTFTYKYAIKVAMESERNLSDEELDAFVEINQCLLIISADKFAVSAGANDTEPDVSSTFYFNNGKLHILTNDGASTDIEMLADGNLCMNHINGKTVFEKVENTLAINDEAKLLKEDEKVKVMKAMQQLLPYTNVGFTTYSGDDKLDSAIKAQRWGEATFERGSCFVVFIIDMTNRHLDIFVTRPLSKILTSDILNSIATKVFTKATQSQYADCAAETFSLVRNALTNDEISSDEFIFRGKIKWGMTEDEVATLEGPPTDNMESDLYTTVYYEAVPVSNYKGTLRYTFITEQLAMSAYTIFDADQNMFDNLRKALSVVYGDELEVDKKEFLTIFNKTLMDPFFEEDLEVFSISKWENPDGTMIYMSLYSYENVLSIQYVSPEYVLWTPEDEENITGL